MSIGTNNYKAVAEVYLAYDYSIFKRLEGNREVVARRKAKILNSIKNVGYVRNPIIVNRNLEIIDGQGRFEALKELGAPIEFVFADNAGLEECVALNLGQTNWKPIDYVKSYAQQGNENYILFLETLESYPCIQLQVLYGIATNTINYGGAGTKTMKNGDLKFTGAWKDEIEPSLQFLTDYDKVVKEINGYQRVISTGIAWVINNTKVDVKRLGKIIANKYPIIKPVITGDMFLNDLSNIYNKGLSAKNCMYFDTEYKMALKRL